MAKINEIRISMGRTINLGNYESARVDVEAAARLDESDDVPLEYERLKLYVYNRMEEQAQALRQEAG